VALKLEHLFAALVAFEIELKFSPCGIETFALICSPCGN